MQMLPVDANPMGNVHGGTILKLVDTAAAVAALRHARTNVVSASIDRMDFYHPVYVGNLLILKASVNYAGRTSMEVGVRIEAEDLKTGKVTHTGSSKSYRSFPKRLRRRGDGARAKNVESSASGT